MLWFSGKGAVLSPRSLAYGLALPVAYLIVELAFNDQLLRTLGDTAPADVLSGLEFWGRVISGVGLGILLHRGLTSRLTPRLAGWLISIGVGVLVMWHVQKALIDHLVEAASPQDKRASVALAVLAPKAGQGALLTPAGQKLVTMETIGLHRNIVEAMFPAAALHAPQREQLLLQWLMTAGHAPAAGVQPAQVEDNAYRNLIVAPLVIGLSLFFALVNLSVAASFVVCARKPRWRLWVAVVLVLLLVGVSMLSGNALLDAEGYRSALRPGLWEQAPVLAAMVEWSARAATCWAPVSQWVHEHLMFGYGFGPIHLARWGS